MLHSSSLNFSAEFPTPAFVAQGFEFLTAAILLISLFSFVFSLIPTTSAFTSAGDGLDTKFSYIIDVVLCLHAVSILDTMYNDAPLLVIP